MLLQIPFLASKRRETVEKDLSVGETGTEKNKTSGTPPKANPLSTTSNHISAASMSTYTTSHQCVADRLYPLDLKLEFGLGCEVAVQLFY